MAATEMTLQERLRGKSCDQPLGREAAAELDRLQARVAELEVDAERLTDDGAEDIRALADRLLGRTASFPDMRQAALLLQDMYLEHRTASRKAKP